MARRRTIKIQKSKILERRAIVDDAEYFVAHQNQVARPAATNVEGMTADSHTEIRFSMLGVFEIFAARANS